ncbi:MAG: hypothetical protein K5Q68_01885 [Roseococcus sp.]|nr:hypothetical protein [Roseococcus sp.]
MSAILVDIAMGGAAILVSSAAAKATNSATSAMDWERFLKKINPDL